MTSGDIYFGDCLEDMKLLPANSIDMILCDLPYGTTACKWDSIIPLEELWSAYQRICKGAIALTASQPFTSRLVNSNIKNFKYEWIWKKNAGSNFALTKYQPMKEHESILIFAYKKFKYFPIKQPRVRPIKAGYVNMSNTGKRDVMGGFENKGFTVTDGEMRVPSSVQSFNRERGLHPTQKPVALFEYLIKTYTNEGDTVLDNCAGSGTTGIACVNTNRKYILMEKEQKYIDIIQKRLGIII